jgi:hypothetical protein
MTLRLIFIILFPVSLMGQSNREMEWKKINKEDSLRLNTTWTTFLLALENKDDKTIRKISLPTISCDLCWGPDSDYKPNDLVPVDTFIYQTNRSFLTSPLYKAIKKRGVRYSTLTIPDFQPGNVLKSDSKDLLLFEVWVTTYVADEWAKGHEGQSHAFQFVKIKEDFKFYGMTSVP